MNSFDQTAYEQEIERNFRWNFVVNALDGAFFWFALTFASPSTILPVYVSYLTDSKLALGLVAALPSVGWLLPQLLTAPFVERMPRKKPFFVWTSLATERIAFLFMAAGAYFLSQPSPRWALIVFFVTLSWHAFGAGTIATAWQEMVAKVIPVRWRGRFFGLTNFLGAAMGLPGAALATIILSDFPYPTNFALCFFITFVGVVLSWVAVTLTREPAGPIRQESESPALYVRRLSQIIRTDVNFAHFLIARIVGTMGSMFVGFIAVAAIQRFHLPDEVAGQFTGFLVGGQLIANLIYGPIADRFGHKRVLEIGALSNIGTAALALLAPAPAWIYLAFALQGSTVASYIMSGMSITFEFSEPEVRPTYIGLSGTVIGVFSGIAPLIGGWLAERLGYNWLFGLCLAILIASWAMLHWWVVDPRFMRIRRSTVAETPALTS
ncbi:MAG: MFS transporter [Anaerolineae bacterium]|nr:MFS transporter [Anaerolineae bacterium]MDW8099129.1 MFS transporter [Anaerolineae bacterium]